MASSDPGAGPDLRSRLGEDLRAAMRARDRLRTDVLRTTLAAIANAEAVPSTAPPNVEGRHEPTEVARLPLDEHDVAVIVGREIEDLRAEIALRQERALPLGDLEARVDVLTGYLEADGTGGASGPGAP